MINEFPSDSPFPTSGAGPTGVGSGSASGYGGASAGLGSTGASTGTGYAGQSAMAGDAGDAAHGTVSRVAQRAHEAVDRMEEAIGSSGERMRDWQQEYGDMAREQVRANPLAAVGAAFLAGLIFGRVFMR